MREKSSRSHRGVIVSNVFVHIHRTLNVFFWFVRLYYSCGEKLDISVNTVFRFLAEIDTAASKT